MFQLHLVIYSPYLPFWTFIHQSEHLFSCLNICISNWTSVRTFIYLSELCLLLAALTWPLISHFQERLLLYEVLFTCLNFVSYLQLWHCHWFPIFKRDSCWGWEAACAAVTIACAVNFFLPYITLFNITAEPITTPLVSISSTLIIQTILPAPFSLIIWILYILKTEKEEEFQFMFLTGTLWAGRRNFCSGRGAVLVYKFNSPHTFHFLNNIPNTPIPKNIPLYVENDPPTVWICSLNCAVQSCRHLKHICTF